MNTVAAHLAVLHKHPWDDGDLAAAFAALVDAGSVDAAVDAWLDNVAAVDDDAHADVAEVVHERGLGGAVAAKALALLEQPVWPEGWRAVVEFVVDAGFDADRVWAICERVRGVDVQLWCALVPDDARAVPHLRRILVAHADDPWIVAEAADALARSGAARALVERRAA